MGLGADYVRPKPRKALHFPWKPKDLSLPYQVTLSSISYLFLGYNFLVHDSSNNYLGKFDFSSQSTIGVL